jgi:hypothetical protein
LHPFRLQTQFSQHTSGNAAFLANQAKEQVFCTNVIVAHPLSFLVSQTEHTTRPLCKTLHAGQNGTSYSKQTILTIKAISA